VLYCNTDYVIFVQNLDEAQRVITGDYLGELTDELEESGSGPYIEEFVSGGPKNYTFSVFYPTTGKRTTKCKVKGITLNYENSKVLNFAALRRLILVDVTPLHVQYQENQKKAWWCSSI
jgi:hypothetical protein